MQASIKQVGLVQIVIGTNAASVLISTKRNPTTSPIPTVNKTYDIRSRRVSERRAHKSTREWVGRTLIPFEEGPVMDLSSPKIGERNFFARVENSPSVAPVILDTGVHL